MAENKRKQGTKRGRKKQRERLYLGVFAASLIGVMVLFITLMTVMSGKFASGSKNPAGSDSPAVSGTADKEDAKSGTNPLTAQPLEPETPEETPERTITISAAGDCTLGTDENFDYATSLPAKYEEMGDPGYFFANVRDIFEQDDLTIVNLEGALTTSGVRADKTFAFRGDPSYVQILTSGSVEACNVANNHSKDYGSDAFGETVAHVEEAGMLSFGYDSTAVFTAGNGITVGLVGAYELAEGLGCQAQMEQQVRAFREQGTDLVIVSFHWGIEKENVPNDTQITLAHAAIDAGADLVLGHHPHVLQGIENYNGKYIVYSLGNFCFGGNKNPSDKDTMIFQQTFTVRADGVAKDDQIRVIPCRITSDSSYNNYQPTPATGEEAERILARIEEYGSYLK